MRKFIIPFVSLVSLLNSCVLTDRAPCFDDLTFPLLENICLYLGEDYTKLSQAKEMLPKKFCEELKELYILAKVRKRLENETAEVSFDCPYFPIYTTSFAIDEYTLFWRMEFDPEEGYSDDDKDTVEEKLDLIDRRGYHKNSVQAPLKTIIECFNIKGSDVQIHLERGKNGIPTYADHEYLSIFMTEFHFKKEDYDPASFIQNMIKFAKVASEKIAAYLVSPQNEEVDSSGSEDENENESDFSDSEDEHQEIKDELTELFSCVVEEAEAKVSASLYKEAD